MAVAADEGIGATARHRASAVVPENDRPPVLDEMFPRRPRGGRRIAIVAALLTGTVAVSGVSAASGNALPGETLYNVKRSTERAQLALAGDDVGRAQLHLEFARTRIQEATDVGGDPEAAAEALTDAAGELRSGVSLLGEAAVADEDETPLDYIDLFTNEHRLILETMIAELDGEASEAGMDLLALVDDAAVRSVDLRGALPCTGPGGETDGLGPVPGSCGSGHDTVDDADRQGPDDPTVSGDGSGDGESSPSSADEPSNSVGDDQTSPEGEPSSSPSGQGDEPSQDQSDGAPEDGRVLDELSGIVEDVFG